MKTLLLLIPILLLSACGNELQIAEDPIRLSGKVFEVSSKKELTLYEFLNKTRSARILVLGEKHYTDPVQKAEAEIIRAVVEFRDRKGNFNVGWEFLNFTDQQAITEDMAAIRSAKITIDQFLDKSQGVGKGKPYFPVIASIIRLNGKLIGTNLPRSMKSEIVKKGAKDADPKLFPPKFEIGGANYFERFKDAIGDTHGVDINNLFAAQSVTDSWMAEMQQNVGLNFLINGSFHSDYRDGVVTQLQRKGFDSVAIRIVESTDPEAQPENWQHQKYGQLSDYVVVTQKP